MKLYLFHYLKHGLGYKGKEMQQKEAITRLREMCPLGTTVYFAVRSYNRVSGKYRATYHIVDRNRQFEVEIFDITYWVATVCGVKTRNHRDGGITTSNPNLTIHHLAWKLYDDDRALVPAAI